VAGLITYGYSPHDPLSAVVSIPLLFPASMIYPEHYDWLFNALMVLFGSLFYGFVILLFAAFIREVIAQTRTK
jgi:hypothetical protein